MTVVADARNVASSAPIEFQVTTGEGTTTHSVRPAAVAALTVRGRVAAAAGVTVRESSVLVAAQQFSSSCPAVPDPFEGISHFSPLSPRRVLDTRPESRVGHVGGKPSAFQTTEVALAGMHGIPANATAVVLNITATESEGPGFVQAFPTGSGRPGESSNVNLERAGQTIPNAAIVKLGSNGSITLYTSTATHLVLDVSGAFVPATPILSTFVAGEGRFYSVTPTRMLDTRPRSAIQYSGAKPTAGQIVEFSVAPTDPAVGISIPANAPQVNTIGSVVLNVTATEASGPGFVQAAAGGALVPGASSNLNLERAGQTIPNLVIVPVSANRTVSLFTSAGTHLVADVLGYFNNSESGFSSQSGLFVPLRPERILDTRDAFRTDGGSYDAGPGATTLFVDQLPNAVGAVVLSVVATEAAGPGYVQVGPNELDGGLALGAHSNLNLERVGQTIPNLVISQSNQRGVDGVTFYSSGGSELVADIFGWFTYTGVG